MNGIQEVSGSIPLISTTKLRVFYALEVFYVLKSGSGIERRLLAVCRRHAATAVAFPQKSDPAYLHHTRCAKRLVNLKNELIRQGRYTDCVDDLILKIIDAPVKKVKTA